jgi:hypothetical protein
MVVAALFSGCVLTVDEAVPESEAVFDARLVGTWRGESDDRAVVHPGDSLTYVIDYRDKNSDVRLGGRLGRLGDRTVLDVWAWPREGELPEPYETLLIQGHLVLAIDVEPDSIRLAPVEPDSLMAAIGDGRLRLSTTEARDQLIIHGASEETRPQFEVLFGHPEWLAESDTWYRVAGK